jgi:HEPN domain-containing protein
MAESLPESSEARRWLEYAREDLAHGKMGAPHFPRSATWNFQQAAEKALKAVLLHRGEAIPKSHDVAFILAAIMKVHPSANAIHEDVLTLAELSPAIRYPGDWPVLSASEVDGFAAAATAVVAWCQQFIEG